MRVMKPRCKVCGAPAIIKKIVHHHPELDTLYCACNDMECGHTFVLNITFSHTLSPSAKTADKLFKAVVDGMNPQQRQMVMEFLQQPTA
ncbi:ogr/Delta-like zinc finger family protein [Candidatus Sodalis pierantonius]|nr:ogr/Delta-like zinc finger family protein [Candidatus Sodalis pierantonius]